MNAKGARERATASLFVSPASETSSVWLEAAGRVDSRRTTGSGSSSGSWHCLVQLDNKVRSQEVNKQQYARHSNDYLGWK